MAEFRLSDRYSALGIPRPDPQTVCKGQCEGTGIVPVCTTETDFISGRRVSPEARRRWRRMHRIALLKSLGLHALRCEGYHFIECERCAGAGKEPGKEAR